MSILTLRRLTLAGLIDDKPAVLERLQRLGCLHLLALGEQKRPPEQRPSARAVEATKALRHLCDLPQRRRQIRNAADFDMATTVATVLANRQRLRDVGDRRDALRQRVSDLEPWGEFRLPPTAELAGEKLWFYIVPQRQMRELDAIALPWQVVHNDHRHCWVVVVSKTEPAADALPVARIHTGSDSLSTVRQQLEAAEIELEEVQAEREALTRWIYLMSSRLARAEDAAGLRYAQAQTHDDEALFLVQGWAAERDVAAVERLAKELGLALILETPRADDAPPTLLDNTPALAAGQDLVGFYQMPAYGTWDPSRVLFFSFTLFFALILSDAGYALVLSALLAAYWHKLGHGALGQRLRMLAAALCAASLVWGVLVGSFFGLTPPSDGLIGRLKLFDVHDFDTMMMISIGIGVLHLVLANAEMALVHRLRAPGRVAIGWMAAILGGFVLWLGSSGTLHQSAALVGQILLIGGLALILLLGSERPVSGAASLLWRALDGLGQLVKVTQAFGDVLSYLRLFALGLASASLAITFNDLARQAAAGLPGLGLFFALLILLVGHVLNLALTLMSGVVHGLRLNFIEFYNWALAGEGYPFKPFKKAELRE